MLAAVTNSPVLARKGLPSGPDKLAQPLVLPASASQLQLHLFFTRLNRRQSGADTAYRYAADGRLRLVFG